MASVRYDKQRYTYRKQLMNGAASHCWAVSRKHTHTLPNADDVIVIRNNYCDCLYYYLYQFSLQQSLGRATFNPFTAPLDRSSKVGGANTKPRPKQCDRMKLHIHTLLKLLKLLEAGYTAGDMERWSQIRDGSLPALIHSKNCHQDQIENHSTTEQLSKPKQ